MPIPYCKSHGIQVSNTPDVTISATAETTLYLMLAVTRKFGGAERTLRRGAWLRECELGREPRGKTLGIVGMGAIGSEVARRARGGLRVERVLYTKRARLGSEQEAELGGAEFCGLDTLLREADIVSVHVPLSPATRNLIGARQLSLMKPSAVLINTSRGGVVDETALLKALDEGRLAGAGLDVFEGEPEIRAAWREREDCVVLPHVGTHTFETRLEMDLRGLRNLRAALEGEGKVEDLVAELK